MKFDKRKSTVIVISLMIIPVMYEFFGEHLIAMPIVAKGILLICYTAIVVGIVNHIDKSK